MENLKVFVKSFMKMETNHLQLPIKMDYQLEITKVIMTMAL